MQVRGLGIYMHCDISRCCGILHYAGRVEADERPKLLLHRMFQDVTSKGLLEPSKDVTFTLHQRDLIPLHRPLHKTLPVVVLQATVQSPTCSLREARITLTLLDSEFLAMEQPRAGAEVIEPRDVDGSIKFCESSYADSAPGRAVYVGYETAGSMSISILSKTSVEMKLTPDQGRRTVSSLSGLLLMCLAYRNSYRVAVSTRANALVLACRHSCNGQAETHVHTLNEEVHISL